MKKSILIVGVLLSLGFASHALADGFVPLTSIPGLTTGATATNTGLATFLNNLYKYLIGVAAIIAVIEIIIGGLEIAGESVSKKTAGKERIEQAILGLVLVLSPVLVFSIINPSILNLSVNLPTLDTVTATSTQNTSGAQWCLAYTFTGGSSQGSCYQSQAECEANKPSTLAFGYSVECRQSQ